MEKELGKHLVWLQEIEHFSRPIIQSILDTHDLLVRDGSEVNPFGEILPDEPVRVLIRPSLPRAVRISKIDLDSRFLGKQFVLGHLAAPVIREGTLEVPGKALHCPSKRLSDGHGIMGGERYEEEIARHPFHECAKGAVRGLAAHDEIAFPVARNGTICNLGRPFRHRNRIGNTAPFGMGMLSVLPECALLPQAHDELFFERSPWQDVDV
mgnify:CR=1 FL=1